MARELEGTRVFIFCKYSALFLVHKIVDHKIVDQSQLIDYLVAFGRVLQNLGAFGRIFRSLFGYTAR